MVHRGGAKGIGRANERRASLGSQTVRELADRRGLSSAVHAHDEDDAGSLLRPRRRPVGRGEDVSQLVGHQGAQADTCPSPAPHGVEQAPGCGQSHVGAQEQLFELVDRFRIDARPWLDRVHATGDVVEPPRQPLDCACQPLGEFVEQAHRRDLSRDSSADHIGRGTTASRGTMNAGHPAFDTRAFRD